MTPPHFYTFVIISPLKRTWPFIWTNLNSLHPRIMCTKFDWIWPAGSEEEDFLKFSMYFYSFAIISPWRGAIQFLWTNLNPLHSRMICAKSGYNWSSDSGEEVENVKVYRQTDGRTDRRTPDNGRSEKLTWAFSSGELKIWQNLRTVTKKYWIFGHYLNWRPYLLKYWKFLHFELRIVSQAKYVYYMYVKINRR
jgi:hypothetical protein